MEDFDDMIIKEADIEKWINEDLNKDFLNQLRLLNLVKPMAEGLFYSTLITLDFSDLKALENEKIVSGFDVFQDSKMIDYNDIKKLSDEKPTDLFVIITFRDGGSLNELEDCVKSLRKIDESINVLYGYAINPDIETRYRITGIFLK